MRALSIKKANAFILVFAVDDARSWEEVANLRQQVRSGHIDVSIIIPRAHVFMLKFEIDKIDSLMAPEGFNSFPCSGLELAKFWGAVRSHSPEPTDECVCWENKRGKYYRQKFVNGRFKYMTPSQSAPDPPLWRNNFRECICHMALAQPATSHIQNTPS